MDQITFRRVINYLGANKLHSLKPFLISTKQKHGLNSCNAWIQEHFKNHEKGLINLNNNNPTPFERSAEDIDELARELDELSEQPNFKFTPRSTSKKETIKDDLGWSNEEADIRAEIELENNAIRELINNRTPIETILNKNKSFNSKETKPHKDEIYDWYAELKRKNTVDEAYQELCKKIESNGLKTSDYFKTDTPQNFDAAYRKWYRKKN